MSSEPDEKPEAHRFANRKEVREGILEQAGMAKPKVKRGPKAAIVPIAPPSELRLGALSIVDPKEMIHRASELATALAEIIHKRVDNDGKPMLYVIIQGKKYVKAEGWTTLGAMLGVVPIEESCDPIEGGYKAKVKLVRLNDGMQVGGASAICKLQEKGWGNPEAFATHSKAITRATGKAFRLSFAWVMKLAGFEATPADELFEVEGSEEEANKEAEKKIGKEVKKAEQTVLKESIFIVWPPEHNGHRALIMGKTAMDKFNLQPYVRREMAGEWNDREGGYFVGPDVVPDFKKLLAQMQVPFMERGNGHA